MDIEDALATITADRQSISRGLVDQQLRLVRQPAAARMSRVAVFAAIKRSPVVDGCFLVSNRQIARDLNCYHKTVRRIIQELVRAGYLHRYGTYRTAAQGTLGSLVAVKLDLAPDYDFVRLCESCGKNPAKYTFGVPRCCDCEPLKQIVIVERTHCRNGHRLLPENLFFDSKGHQRCRLCAHEAYLRKRAALPPLQPRPPKPPNPPKPPIVCIDCQESRKEHAKLRCKRCYERHRLGLNPVWDPMPRRNVNREKTHCANGHPYDEVNTYITPSTGGRVCRTCHRERMRQRRLAGYSDSS